MSVHSPPSQSFLRAFEASIGASPWLASESLLRNLPKRPESDALCLAQQETPKQAAISTVETLSLPEPAPKATPKEVDSKELEKLLQSISPESAAEMALLVEEQAVLEKETAALSKILESLHTSSPKPVKPEDIPLPPSGSVPFLSPKDGNVLHMTPKGSPRRSQRGTPTPGNLSPRTIAAVAGSRLPSPNRTPLASPKLPTQQQVQIKSPYDHLRRHQSAHMNPYASHEELRNDLRWNKSSPQLVYNEPVYRPLNDSGIYKPQDPVGALRSGEGDDFFLSSSDEVPGHPFRIVGNCLGSAQVFVYASREEEEAAQASALRRLIRQAKSIGADGLLEIKRKVMHENGGLVHHMVKGVAVVFLSGPPVTRSHGPPRATLPSHSRNQPIHSHESMPHQTGSGTEQLLFPDRLEHLVL